MRPYRGLTKEGKWVYGWYCCTQTRQYTDGGHPERHFIIQNAAEYMLDRTEPNVFDITEAIEVIPESVGQFTDLRDKNGTEIYEGDIIKVLSETLIGHFHGTVNCNVFVRKVIWNSNNGRWVFSCAGGRQYLPWEDGSVEVIGNIPQNPKLMEKENA